MRKTIVAKNKSVDKPQDPLWAAYVALGDATDLTTHKVRKNIWRSIWARDTLREWTQRITQTPTFAFSLHRGIPLDDIELLKEMKAIAMENPDSASFYIAGLVNERIEQMENLPLKMQGIRFQRYDPELQLLHLSRRDVAIDSIKYDGYICAAVFSAKEGRAIAPVSPGSKTDTILQNAELYQLRVWFQSHKDTKVRSERLLVESGIEDTIVNFGVELDSATINTEYGRKSFSFYKNAKSEVSEFGFATPAKSSSDFHIVSVHVYQGAKYIKSLLIPFRVTSSKTLTEKGKCLHYASK